MYRFLSRPKSRSSSYVAIISCAVLSYGVMTALSAQKTESVDSRVFVEGVTIHLNHNAPPVAALEDVLMENDFNDEQIPLTVKTSLASGVNSMREIAERIISDNQLIDRSSPQEVPVARQFVVQAQAQTQTASSHVRNIDLKSVGISRQELLDALFMPMINHDPAIINRGGQNKAPVYIPVAQHHPSTGGEQVISPRALHGATVAGLDPALAANITKAEITKQSFAPSSDPAKQIIINGAIEVSQGLAFTSPKDRIVVYREDKGQMFETGNVWAKQGRFEIGVANTSGLLVAELRTQAGEVLGSGRATMDQSKIMIRLSPTTQGLVGRVVAANSSDQFEAHPLKSAKLMLDMIPHEFVSEAGGKFSDPNIVNQSTAILRTQKSGFLPGISVASAGEENVVPMYSNKMVIELLSLQKNAERVNNPEGLDMGALDMKNMAIVWGRVTQNGEPVAGGQVEMITADQSLRPVYFNKMMIPDLSLTATSSNGYYAFVGVNPGVQALQVTQNESLSEPSVIPADANSISQLNIDIASNKTADVMVFDGFHTERSLPASILRLGQTSGVETDLGGQTKLRYSEGTGLMILDVDAGTDYAITRLTLSRTKNTIYSPVVSLAWFDEARKRAGLDVIAYTGTIIGFIQTDRPYKAAFGEKVSDTTRIVYFNSQGEVIPGDVGVPGGGFIVFNAQEGLQTVSVVQQDSEKILTQTTYVDRGVVSVFSHWFH